MGEINLVLINTLLFFLYRKFVYEFELRSANCSGILPFFQKEKIMACIEVPFSSIVGLNISKDMHSQVVIEVKSPPSMYLGKQVLYSQSTGCALPTRYDTSQSVDLSDGQLLTIPYHKIKLSTNHLRSRLQSFDPRFDALLRTPITMDLTKRLTQQDIVKPTKRRKSSEHSGASAKKDVCLMQNITKMKDLDRFLKENEEMTPCCDAQLPMKDICVGVVECPECDGEYRYSWCSFSLCDEECRPRNHCPICKRCGDYRDDHCFNCNKCYFAGSAGSFRCPCAERRVNFIDSLGAFLNCLHRPESDSDNDYY
ncbi:hypothetical protein QZH41_012069 [Actinostola sp. cb2023]|nr:hypothetical protein QZH41_012069 [Actinostola sp. cb2023]